MPTENRAWFIVDEHVLEAAILLADQVADRATVIAVCNSRRGTRVNAELVLDDALNVVARTEQAVGPFGRGFGTRNSEIPLTPSGASVRASTRNG